MVSSGPFPAPRGSQVLVGELAEALSTLGHRVHVVAFGAAAGGREIPGVSVHRIPSFLGGVSAYGPRPWRMALNLVQLRTLYRVVREHAIDIIHAHNYDAPLLGYAIRRLTGVPVIYHGHSVMSDELGRYFERPLARRAAAWFGHLLDRSVPRRADYVVALSAAMASHLAASGVDPEQMEVIPPGVNWPSDAAEAPAGDLYPGAKVIAYAGNLDPYQEVPTLVRAMREVRRAEPRALLVIATHGLDPGIVELVESLGLSSQVRVEQAEEFGSVARLLRRADVLVCPRTSWSGFPIKLLNYMAAGRPIIAAAGAARALGEGPLVVVPDGDAGELARAIVATLRDPAGRDRLGREGMRRVREAHEWHLIAPRVVSVYARVLGRQGRIGEKPERLRKSLAKSNGLRVDGGHRRS